MSRELHAILPAGLTVVAIAYRQSDNYAGRQDTHAWEAKSQANLVSYMIDVTADDAASNDYWADLPAWMVGTACEVVYLVVAGETYTPAGGETIGESTGSGLPGPGAVSIAWKDAANAAVGGVDFTLLSGAVVIGSGRGSSGGTFSTGLSDGTYTVRSRNTASVLFVDATLTVADGSGTLTITGTTRQISPPPTAGQTTAYLTMLDGAGAVAVGAKLQYRLVSGPGAAGVSLDGETHETGGSDSNGLLQVAIYKQSLYQFRRGDGAWKDVSTRGAGDTLELPQILGVPT